MDNNFIENDYVMEDAAAIVSETDAAPYDHYDSSSENDSSTCCSTGTMNNDLGDDDNNNDGNNSNENNYEDKMMMDGSNEGNNNNKNNQNKYGISKIDPLYNPNGDDEDEAYVYKHLRGGIEENVTIRSNKNLGQEQNQQNHHHQQHQHQHQQQRTQELEQAKMLKPRNSDGILSCPCCFQIVCMDCQKHEKYTNQFRAMFVMNIGVDWNVLVSPDHIGGSNSGTCNRENADDDEDPNVNPIDNKRQRKNQIPTDKEHNAIEEVSAEGNNTKKNEESNNEMYYSVYCHSCRTQVAALDMKDEVYHFFGCIVSG